MRNVVRPIPGPSPGVGNITFAIERSIMSALIAALISAIGPILIPALVKWMQSLFKRVAPSVQATGDPAIDATALVGAAIDATPRVRVFKRALLNALYDHAGKLATGDKLTAAEKKELATLAASAKSE